MWVGQPVTHLGEPAYFASSLPTLLKLAKKRSMYAGLLGCAKLPRFHAVPQQHREVKLLDWSVCPLDLLDSPFARLSKSLYDAAQVSPLTGWPDKFAPWAVYGLMAQRG